MTNILVIRRDNIGDLVCTTPLLRALKKYLPNVRLCVLGNSYNSSLLLAHPDVDTLFTYKKAKHRLSKENLLAMYFSRARLIALMRKTTFDYTLMAGSAYNASSYRFSQLIKTRHVIGYLPEGGKAGIDIYLHPSPIHDTLHEVEKTFQLLKPLGICCPPPPLSLSVTMEERQWSLEKLSALHSFQEGMRIAVQISSRKASQRWPIEKYAELIRWLWKTYDAKIALFWSPGDSANPCHPGDDAGAKQLALLLKDVSILPFQTTTIRQLMAGLSHFDYYIGSDGGAMHIAAALGLPCLCFFGKSELRHWHPWKVPYVALQPDSFDVNHLALQEVQSGFIKLLEKTKRLNAPLASNSIPSYDRRF